MKNDFLKRDHVNFWAQRIYNLERLTFKHLQAMDYYTAIDCYNRRNYLLDSVNETALYGITEIDVIKKINEIRK